MHNGETLIRVIFAGLSNHFSLFRYKAIVNPLDIHKSGAGLSVCLRAAAIWLFSATLAIPEAVFSDLHAFTTSHTNETFVTCAPYPHAGELHPKIHSTASLLIFYIIPLLVISVYYCFIARSLIRSSADIPAEGHLHLQRQVCVWGPLLLISCLILMLLKFLKLVV